MILAAGLTPAWQQILEMPSFRHGEVNRAQRVTWCASGKSLNVAIGLSQLGADCLSACVKGGATGELLAADLRELGVATEWVETSASTRVCTTIVELESGVTTELVENALPISANEAGSLVEIVRQNLSRASMLVLSGSLPPGAPQSIYAEILKSSRVPAVIDARGPELLEALAQRPLVVKPNREELGHTLGGSINSEEQLLSGMRRLNALGAQWVVATQGAAEVWMTSESKTYRCQPPAIRPVNAIASGDCLAAGMAWAIDSGESLATALGIGVASAVENALSILPARLDAKRVRERAATIEVESR